MLEDILKSYESFREEILRESYFLGAGLKEKPEYGVIFQKYANLFTLETVGKVIREKNNLPEDAPNEEFEAFDRVIFALLENFLFLKTVQDVQKLQELEISKTVDFNGKSIPFRMVANIIEREENREIRKSLSERTIPIIEELTKYKVELAKKRLNIIRKEFGYPSILSYESAKLKEDIKGYANSLSGFLKETEREYRDLAGWVFKEFLGLDWGEVQTYDITFLLSGYHFRDFKTDDCRYVLDETLKGMGLNLGDMKNLKIDDENRPTKSPRAFCAPIKIPDEVIVVVKPSGYFKDIATLFHEMGHALHFAHTDKSLPEIYRLIGRSGTSEIFAFNFQYITDSKPWIERFFGKKERLESFINYRQFAYLYLRRRYAAKVIYETKLFSYDNWEDIGPKLYSQILTDATGVFHPPYNYFWDLDFGFYSVDYSQAWEVEYALREYLKGEFGEEWYFNEEGGEFLKGLWSLGLRYSPFQLAKKLRLW